ncbi:MAG: glutamate 5-kinase [Myxococcales bacterium]|nr:glutamate 5-kinase [Myxococcales bacterium]
MRERLQAARRVVVKVGSQVLCQPNGAVDAAVVTGLSADVAAARADGRQIVLVSSGAVALGRGRRARGLAGTPAGDGMGKQALAALGQPLLMARWQDAFEVHATQVAQILLTHADLGHRGRFLHARRVMAELLDAGVLPIVNENDTVAVEELGFGDNDQLAAMVAHVVGADALVLLTEVDALYTADPRTDGRARRYAAADPRHDAVLAGAGAGTSHFGTGGMHSKVLAARKAAAVGVVTVVAAGKLAGMLGRVLAGAAEGTVFRPAAHGLTGRRSWIATSARPKGTLQVDAGAARALRSGGASLLPIGVVCVDGSFGVGDVVAVIDGDGQPIGRGRVRYGADDARKVAGLRSDRIAAVLGWLPATELVHRDDFVVAG